MRRTILIRVSDHLIVDVIILTSYIIKCHSVSLVSSLKDLQKSLPLRVAEVIGTALLLGCHDLGHRGLPDRPHDLLKLRPVFTNGYVKTC